MQTTLPMIGNLCDPAMLHRHWVKLLKYTGKTLDINSPSTTFSDILNLGLSKFETEVNDIVDIA